MENKNIYNIPFGTNFTNAFVEGLLSRFPTDSEELAKTLIFLPTRRAINSIKESIINISGAKAALMPTMIALGDPSIDELMGSNIQMLNINPAIGEIKRLLLLTYLVKQTRGLQAKNEDDPISFDHALHISHSLSELLDEFIDTEVPLAKVTDIVPEEYATHWLNVLEFLNIIQNHWPKILSAEQALDIAERRKLIIDATIAGWQQNNVSSPIIAVGINRNIPYVKRLLKAIAEQKNGSVIFQGLEQINDNLWQYYEQPTDNWLKKQQKESTPQWINYNLLKSMNVKTTSFKAWNNNAHNSSRMHMLSNAMVASNLHSLVNHDMEHDDNASPISIIESENIYEEAQNIAIKIRDTLSYEHKTVALVTPNRTLSSLVRHALSRWNITINDSAGIQLHQTPAALYLRLLTQLVIENFRPKTLMAFLKHPFTHMGLSRDKVLTITRKLDIYLREVGDITSLKHYLNIFNNPSRFFRHFDEQEIEDIKQLLHQVAEISEEFQKKLAMFEITANEILTAQLIFAKHAATCPQKDGDKRLWSHDDGKKLSQVLSELYDSAKILPPMSPRRWNEFLVNLLKNYVVRPVQNLHPRANIWGIVESRLVLADVVILGSFNEGDWPKVMSAGPWLSRPMRFELGLPSVEEEIGLTMHDVLNLLGAKETIITRSKKVGSNETTASRWLKRIENWQKKTELKLIDKDVSKRYDYLRAEVYRADKLAQFDIPPTPCPKAQFRPKKLSATNIEKLKNDPYNIYVKKVLNIYPLNDLEVPMNAANFGTITHNILEKGLKQLDSMSFASDDIFKEKAKALFTSYIAEELEFTPVSTFTKQFWQNALLNITDNIIAQELTDGIAISNRLFEQTGNIHLNLDDGTFEVNARGDRFDIYENHIDIIDYKTAKPPTKADIKNRKNIQLHIEAIITQANGYQDINADNKNYKLSYWHIQKLKQINKVSYDISHEELADFKEELTSFLNEFSKEDKAYHAEIVNNKYDDTAHLARKEQWRYLVKLDNIDDDEAD